LKTWVHDNAVKNKFSLSDESENVMYFEQIRMPMYDATGKALDAKGFFKPFSKDT
jgi:hypothetical protein